MFIQPILVHSVPNVVGNESLNVRGHIFEEFAKTSGDVFPRIYRLPNSKTKQYPATVVQVQNILAEQENKRRSLWPFGRVIKLFTGADGHS